jgi:hypothetical protein
MTSKMKTTLWFLFVIFLATGIGLAFVWAGGTFLFPTKAPNLVINEYRLTAAPDISTDQLVYKFADVNQEKSLATTKAYKDYRSQVMDYNNELLKPFGYSLRGYEQYANTDVHWFANLYRGSELIGANVDNMTPVSVKASKTDFVSYVDLSDGNRYLLTNGSFKLYEPAQKQVSGYVGDQLLSMDTVSSDPPKETIRVYLDDKLVGEYSMFPGNPTYASTNGPWTYNGHWALVILDGKQDSQGNINPVTRVIVDGQDLNAINHYEQSFQFALLDGHPFYFFQRNGKIDISFDGKEFPQRYDEVPHYECCTGALLNPGNSLNMIWFFARRGNDWYYVEAYVPITKK